MQFVDGTYKCELLERNEFGVWTVKWDNGDTDHTKVPEKKLLREPPAEEESGDEDSTTTTTNDDDAPATVTPVRKKEEIRRQRADGRLRRPGQAHRRALLPVPLFPGDAAAPHVSAGGGRRGTNGAAARGLPTASTTGRKLMAVAKWGNACRYLD